jgi:hypothetical protein
MARFRIDGAQVRDAVTGEFRRDLAGQPITIVARDTTSPFPLQTEVGDPIAGSVVAVMPTSEVPRVWIDVDDASDLYLDWLHVPSGARGPVNFDVVLRDAARASASAAQTAATAAAGAVQRAGDGPVRIHPPSTTLPDAPQVGDIAFLIPS